MQTIRREVRPPTLEVQNVPRTTAANVPRVSIADVSHESSPANVRYANGSNPVTVDGRAADGRRIRYDVILIIRSVRRTSVVRRSRTNRVAYRIPSRARLGALGAL